MTPPVKLACRHVWKLYGPHPDRLVATGAGLEAIRASGHVGAVRDVSLEVGAGEIFVIMGGSGCGKSTLLWNMIGLRTPPKGDILYDGKSFLKADETGRRALVKQHCIAG